MREHELVERNMRRAMRCFARATPSSEIREMPGVLVADAGVETAVFNAALLNARVPSNPMELDRRIALAEVYFQARGRAWSFWLCEDLLAPPLRRAVEAAFARHQLRLAGECPGMIASELRPPTHDLPALECRSVGDAASRAAFCEITSECFRIPLSTSLAIYNEPATWDTELRAFVGCLDGRPVATAATVIAEGVAGVYSVATLPEYRRRGFGERMTRYALQAAVDEAGSCEFVLQSTRLGFALYRRMGFRQVTRILIYVSGWPHR